MEAFPQGEASSGVHGSLPAGRGFHTRVVHTRTLRERSSPGASVCTHVVTGVTHVGDFVDHMPGYTPMVLHLEWVRNLRPLKGSADPFEWGATIGDTYDQAHHVVAACHRC